jgi:hypothetical protein
MNKTDSTIPTRNTTLRETIINTFIVFISIANKWYLNIESLLEKKKKKKKKKKKERGSEQTLPFGRVTLLKNRTLIEARF